MPETDWNAETKTVKPEFGQKVKDTFAFKAEQDVRKSTLPKDPNAYTLDLPADFVLPQGMTKFEFNKDDPTLAQARKVAIARGMDQGTFSDLLGVYAAERVGEAVKIETARQSEIAKLGSTAPARIDAIKTWLHTKIGEELAGQLELTLCNAKQVEAFESIVNQFSRQGGTQFSQGHREGAPEAGKIPGYAEMSFEQRRAAQMNLKAAAGGGR